MFNIYISNSNNIYNTYIILVILLNSSYSCVIKNILPEINPLIALKVNHLMPF